MKVERRSLTEQVRDEIVGRIASRIFLPGDRVVISRLARETGVSDVPVREAIHELVGVGVLENIQHRGATVRELSVTEIAAALEVRAAIEAIAARRAASTAGVDTRSLARIASETVKSSTRGDLDAFRRSNREFHETLISNSGVPILERIWRSLLMVINTLDTSDYVDETEFIESAKEHEAISEAVERGDARVAAQLTEGHFRSFIHRIQTSVEGVDAVAGSEKK